MTSKSNELPAGGGDAREWELAVSRSALRAASGQPDDWYSRGGKRVLDIVGTLIIFATFLPIIVVVACLMGLQGGNVMFWHERVGRKGRFFRCYKFRSMVPDAERRLEQLLASDPQARAEWDATRKLEDDPRITFLGRFLRRTSLDELPQLWNVLRGDMSLVGPRPVTQEELARYGASVAAYLSIRPGLTGPWQVSGRNDISYDERVRMDCDYAANYSLSRDLQVLWRTVWVVAVPNGK
ncbi:sugar transferase [Paracoccus stylophorae]|uniref:Sugar transferase n=1 Tax=Paracoccus stylophorae TaxID=659350 RepID=A0ABY7SUY0_9RHOB|nr:sugar transferase [Paracoccus stylophorae]WCR10721.1 sugar transferase [Paracoccus stylophorae]